MKRKCAWSLCVAVLFSIFSGYGSCGATNNSMGMPVLENAGEELSDDVVDTTDISEYENNEVFVMYTDGSAEVLTYESKDAVKTALQELPLKEGVMLVQPNYTYKSDGFPSSDELLSQQWALYNDGSFYMEEEENEFPVFDDPFGEPSDPWEWRFPDRGGFWWWNSWGGYTAQATKATVGIDVNADEAWSIYNGGTRDVTVAMVDTGIDYTHEDLAGRIWTNTGEVTGNGIDDDGNGYIDDVYGWNFYNGSNCVYTGEADSHGTHGAGTISASADNEVGIAGIVQSSHVKVMAVKALGGYDGSGSTESIINAIRYAENNGAKICNLSLGTNRDDRALYTTIANSDMLFVVAAGNDGYNTDIMPSYPAAYELDNIISVANLNYDGNLHYSSNFGISSVDIAAPGTYILSTTPGNTYSYMTGTSMAAPMVSAAAAMVYSYYGSASLADVKEILLSTAKKLDVLSGRTMTGGMLDIGAAMKFDLTKLSGIQWVKDSAEYKGSAPEIQTRTVGRRGVTYLILNVIDYDGDLSSVSYASGSLSAEEFRNGNVGTPVTLGKNGSVTFIANPGVYTFYAVDCAGNEAVNTVKVNPSSGITRTRWVFEDW